MDKYKLILNESDEAGVFILEALFGNPSRPGYRLTIDANRGYNITKCEEILFDGTKISESNYKLKQHSNGVWFLSERQQIRFDRTDPTKTNIDEILIVNGVQFDIPTAKEEIFKPDITEGTRIWDSTFYYMVPDCDFAIGSLREPKHTEEATAVTAILDQTIGKGQDTWGLVRELTINNIVERKNFFIDFDTGKLWSLPTDFHLIRDPDEWLKENSIDGRVETDAGLGGLWGFNTVVIPVKNERFDTIKPAACHKVLSEIEGVKPPIMSAEGKLPTTYLFQTWDGRGILQILSINKDKHPHSIKIRYKMIQEKSSYPN